jgi:transcriptional regulator with XRE-family HTH domain
MKTHHEILMEDPEFRRLLSLETLAAQAAEEIARRMTEQNVNQADLAGRLNKSRACVTQLLNGKVNGTLHTLAEVVHTLGAGVKLQARPQSRRTAGKKIENRVTNPEGLFFRT